ncbi:MAG: hypothetical protein VYA99_10145 [Pseudomonadota bacterium]|nr:hypothetical protein [Pseudomonadota bacterium]
MVKLLNHYKAAINRMIVICIALSCCQVMAAENTQVRELDENIVLTLLIDRDSTTNIPRSISVRVENTSGESLDISYSKTMGPVLFNIRHNRDWILLSNIEIEPGEISTNSIHSNESIDWHYSVADLIRDSDVEYDAIVPEDGMVIYARVNFLAKKESQQKGAIRISESFSFIDL